MNYVISASTDIGIRKATNQDSLFVRTLQTPLGNMVLAVLCDGMGGLSKGEVASATLISAFTDWMNLELPLLCREGLTAARLRSQWTDLIVRYNEKIMQYGTAQGVSLGTTVVALLLTDSDAYILNVGDSRVYLCAPSLCQLTQDQTLVAREVAQGLLTPAQAETDPRRNVLLQCVGASNRVVPDFFCGQTVPDAVYFLCSDGFRHVISPQELEAAFSPAALTDPAAMQQNELALIERNKQRGEDDNISVITIRTY